MSKVISFWPQGHSHWYIPGSWQLPHWWTDGPPMRAGDKCSYQELVDFYNSKFVRNILGHTGGITTLPICKEKDNG